MADVFNINWVQRMKTDPRANSILNNKTKFETFYTWNIRPNPAGRPRYLLRNRQTFTRRMNQSYSARYIKEYRSLKPRGPGRYRRDGRRTPRREYVDDNPNKYWENTIGKPLYRRDSIANAPNPYIEKLAYNE